MRVGVDRKYWKFLKLRNIWSSAGGKCLANALLHQLQTTEAETIKLSNSSCSYNSTAVPSSLNTYLFDKLLSYQMSHITYLWCKMVSPIVIIAEKIF